ncbi:unnamed protein product [Urochloa humidicola]
MDRSWVHGRLFSTEYMDGVKEFMKFVKGKFRENVEIQCPCARCLNHKYHPQSLVKKHILMHGMDCSYTRWVQHGEGFNVDVSEQPIDVHYNADLVGSSYGENLRDDGSADLAGSIPGEDVREDDSVDRLEGLLGDQHAAVDEEGRQDAENEDGDAEPHDKE